MTYNSFLFINAYSDAYSVRLFAVVENLCVSNFRAFELCSLHLFGPEVRLVFFRRTSGLSNWAPSPIDKHYFPIWWLGKGYLRTVQISKYFKLIADNDLIIFNDLYYWTLVLVTTAVIPSLLQYYLQLSTTTAQKCKTRQRACLRNQQQSYILKWGWSDQSLIS